MVGLIQSILAGLFLAASFPPVGLWICSFIGLALLFRSIVDLTLQTRLYRAFIAGSAFFLPLLHWSGTYVGAIPWLILALGESVLFATIALLPYDRSITAALRFAAFFSLIELLRMKVPFGGFGWGRMGFTQVDILHTIYPFVGVSGVTFIIAFFAALLASSQIRLLVSSTLTLILVVLLTPGAQATSTFPIAGVQGGVDKLGLDFNDRALSVMNRHAQVTLSHQLRGSQLIVWPENAADRDPISDINANRILRKTLSSIDAPLLIGAVEQRGAGPINTSLLFANDGTLIARYTKQDLAPFGEYIPLRRLAEAIAPQAGEVRDFQSGTQWMKFQIGQTTFATLICFEVLDDDHVRSGARNTEFLVAQTNNATFGTSAQAAQQLQITRARAAELGRSFMVVSTTGFTVAIDNQGNIFKSIPQFKAGVLNAELPLASNQTLASRLGSKFWIAVFLTLVALTFRTRVYTR